jgi:hypothetical protein
VKRAFEPPTLSPERLRSLAALWRSQHANDIEVAAARRRFALGVPRTELSFGLRMLGLASALVLLAGVAVAGAGVSRWVESRSADRSASVVPTGSPAKVSPKRARTLPATPGLQPAPDLPAPPTSAQPTPASPPDGESLSGRAAPTRKSSLRLEHSIEAAEQAGQEPGPATVRGAWARLAADLRDGKSESARTAIDELSRSADPATRDAALLVGAQLDLAAGRSARARSTLAELSERGATEVIRRRARALLQ